MPLDSNVVVLLYTGVVTSSLVCKCNRIFIVCRVSPVGLFHVRLVGNSLPYVLRALVASCVHTRFILLLCFNNVGS